MAHNGQFSYCDRVGRDFIQLELKKLYEGVPPTITRNWHRFATSPQRGSYAALTRVPNVATRAKALTYALVTLGENLSALASAVRLHDLGPSSFVTLNRGDLDYRGWWTFPDPEAVARHVPRDMPVDAFLEKCLAGC